MLHRSLARALLGATTLGLAAVPAPAAAQRVDRIVAFGDSYADPGNALALAGIDPLSTVIYPTGRFSGGTNYVDTLSSILDVPVFNFAVGGARTNTGNQTFGLPGFTSEVAIFSSGGAVGPFPAIEPTFDEDDLVTISIGGNDARAYQQGGGTVAGAAADAAVAVGFAEAGIDVLVEAGAPTISFLAGDTSRLPEVDFYPDPAGARAVRSAYSSAFNLGMQDVLAGYAADGVIVHYLDLNAILDQIVADPGAFGFTGIACPAFPPPAGPGSPGNPVCAIDPATAAQYVFYGDQLHLTSAGFAIVGQYVAAQLQAPLTFEATSDLALDTAQQFGRTLSTRMDFMGDGEQGLRFFVVGDSFSTDVEESEASDAFDIDSVGATAGIAYSFGSGMAGLAVNYSRPKARFGNDAARTRSKTLQVGAFAGFEMGGAFAQGYVGYGRDDHRIRREGVVEAMRASPDGSHWLAGAKAGYLISSGDFKLGPFAALDYAKARVDDYTEEGDPALNLEVDSVSAKSLIGSVGAQFEGDVTAGGLKIQPLVELALEKELNDDTRTFRFAQTSAPGIVNSWEVDEGSSPAYGRVTLGFAADILSGVAIDAQGSLTLGRDDGEETSAHVGLRVGF
jgi:phospholipase/lecithinase/hemolysin/uncharacterized protein YhjY with autotransporter beta-barrel domain